MNVMSTNKTDLMRLIIEEVEKALWEQAPAPPPEEPLVPDVAGDVPGEEGAGGDLDLAGDIDLGGGDLGGEGLPGEENLEGEEGEEGLDDFGGGGSFGGLGGGGGGFGDDGEPGLDSDQEEEEGLLTTVGPEDVEIPSDPVGAITDDAIQMLAQTRQTQPILRNVKAQIQKYFDDFEDATPVVKALWDTEDLVLRDVARRLLLFVRGV